MKKYRMPLWMLLFRTVEQLKNCHDRREENTRPSMKTTLSRLKVMESIMFQRERNVMLKEIADELGITSGAVSQTVDRLVAEGLLERRASMTDRRAVQIGLSEKGVILRNAADAQFTKLQEELLDGLDSEKMAVFRDVLEYLLNRLDEQKIKDGAK